MRLWLQKQLQSNQEVSVVASSEKFCSLNLPRLEAVREGSVTVVSNADSRTDTPPVQTSTLFFLSDVQMSLPLHIQFRPWCKPLVMCRRGQD